MLTWGLIPSWSTDEEGTERLWLIFSEKGVPELEAVKQFANPEDQIKDPDLQARVQQFLRANSWQGYAREKRRAARNEFGNCGTHPGPPHQARTSLTLRPAPELRLTFQRPRHMMTAIQAHLACQAQQTGSEN
jgi:hypothetical protein